VGWSHHDYISVTSRRRAWGSPFNKQPQTQAKPEGIVDATRPGGMDHEAAVEKAIAKAFKGVDTFGDLKILNIDGLIPRKYKAGSLTHLPVRAGHATVVIEFAKRRAGAPRWATIELFTDHKGTWMPPSVMNVEGRAMLIAQAVFDDWFGAVDSVGADHRDKGGWGGPETIEKATMDPNAGLGRGRRTK